MSETICLRYYYRLSVFLIFLRNCFMKHLMPQLFGKAFLGFNVMTSKLRYDIIIHNFHPFIFCICV